MIIRRRAQSLNEYALIIAAVSLAAVTMQTYVKRGIQGVVRQTADVLTAGGTEKSLNTLLPQPKIDLPDGDMPERDANNNLNWHPSVEKYKENMEGGFIVAKKAGNIVSYYHYTVDPDTGELNNGVLIGKEDLTTRDYTEFYQSPFNEEGFAAGVANEEGEDWKDKLGLKFEYNTNEDDEVISVTVKRRTDKKDSEGNYIYEILGIYGKYQMISLTALPEVILQQQGSEESGLYDYKMDEANPLKITNDKSVTLLEKPQNNMLIPETSYHDFISRNYTGTPVPGDDPSEYTDAIVTTKINGNTVYYYLKDKDGNETLIGAENALTRDFTIFNEDGFAEVIFNEAGDPYTDLEFIYNEDPTTKEITSVTVKQGDQIIGTYTKYQTVKISQTPPDDPLSLVTDAIARKITTNQDITTVRGKWRATYKLESAGTFGSLESTKAKKNMDTGGTTPRGD